MEQFSHFLGEAVWAMLIVLAFAIIGVYATIRWIINLIWGAEQAVESGVRSVGDKITHHNE